MNILFTRFPLESAYGGAEVQTLSLMKELKQRGHDVIFMGSCPTLLQKCRTQNIECRILDIGPPPVKKWGAVNFLWRKNGMQKILVEFLETRKSLPEAIFMISLSEKLLLTSWALEHDIRVFWIEHDRISPSLTWNPWLPTLRKLSKNVTTIVVSDLSKKMYRELGWDEEKIIAIPNGVCNVMVSRANHDTFHRAQGDMLHIGCIARLTPDKGVDLLIDAVTDTPEVELTILGRGPEESYFRKIIDERNLSHRIRLQSWIDDTRDFYSSIDVLALPSREHDPFGMVVAEAMCCGVPVIVTQACGIAGYLHDGVDAIVVPENSSLALKEAILKIKTGDFKHRLSDHARKTVKEKFSVGNMVDAYEKLLRSSS